MVKNCKALLARVRGVLLRRGRTADDADDLVQEAWLRMADFERGTPVVEPGAFLMRTALNLSVSAHRARTVRGEVVAVEEISLADRAPDTEAAVLQRERLARLGVCLDRLGDRTRAVFLDVRFGGMSYAEAARHHGISVSAVEKHVAKATMLVTRWMEGW